MAILVDTSALFASVDVSDRHHATVATLLESSSEALIVPITVLPEIDYLLTSRVGSQPALNLLLDIREGQYRLEHLIDGDINRAIDLLTEYADGNIGLVDATLVALAERLKITRIATLDRRHFSAFRPRHVPAFELLP